jgi:hypothetical protein
MQNRVRVFDEELKKMDATSLPEPRSPKSVDAGIARHAGDDRRVEQHPAVRGIAPKVVTISPNGGVHAVIMMAASLR